MIGNDIVDLKHSAPNWKRPRFLDKVFTQNEQALIFSTENEHETLCLLWSMKEAAYKIHVQQFGERFFNPKRLLCELISDTSTTLSTSEKGIVRIDDNCYFTESTITEDYVYTVAKRNHTQEICTSVFKTKKEGYKIQSKLLKQEFIKSISESKGFKFQSLRIEKTAIGIPKIFNDLKQLPIAFSLTHCGRFSGFAY